LLKVGLTAVATAALCFAVTIGLAAGAGRLLTMRVGDIVVFSSDNFHCQAIARTEVACGAKLTPGSVQVYYAPHQLQVIKFGKTLRKGQLLLSVER
jgi:hypothetical protein